MASRLLFSYWRSPRVCKLEYTKGFQAQGKGPQVTLCNMLGRMVLQWVCKWDFGVPDCHRGDKVVSRA